MAGTSNLNLFFLGQGSEWFWVMVQSIVVIITLLFIYRQIKLSRYANMLQTILKFREMWGTKEMMLFRQATCRNYKTQTRAIGKAEGEVLGFFEDMGMLVEKGVISKEFVWEGYSYYIEPYWSMMEKKIKEFREREKDTSWFEHFENLRDAMRKFSKKKGAPLGPLEKKDMQRFIKGELERIKEFKIENA